MGSELTKAQRDFAVELAYENPVPEERWFTRGHWEPSFPLVVIDGMQKKGFIECRGIRLDLDKYEFRFTPAGRAFLAKEGKSDD